MLEQAERMLEWILQNIASFAILLFEFIGVGIIIWSGLKGIIKWLRHSGDTRIYLAKGLAMGLEFRWEARFSVPLSFGNGRKLELLQELLL